MKIRHQGSSIRLGNDVVERPQTLDPALSALLDTEQDRSEEQARYLYCGACGTAITQPQEATSINGSHQHFCVNPHGFEFDVGCFNQALGCTISGEPTHADSWFPGYLWRYAHCAECEQHLGWLFEGSQPPFYGLIRDRLKDAG